MPARIVAVLSFVIASSGRKRVVRSLFAALVAVSITAPAARAASASDLAMLFEAVSLVYDAAGMVEASKKNGRLPEIRSLADLSRARFGNVDALAGMADPWGTPPHIESSPGGAYLVAVAGSDRKFDRSTWGRNAETRSTADDVVLRNGVIVRSPIEWASAEVTITSEQLDSARALSRHRRTVADLRSIASATATYEVDANKLPPATNIDQLAKHLEPLYIAALPRTDGWNRPFKVAVKSTLKSYRVVSAGGDGTFETADDIVLQDHQVVKNADPPPPADQNVDADVAKARTTMRTFEKLADAVSRYKKDHQRVPPVRTLDGLAKMLVPKYIDSVPRADAWGTPLQVAASDTGLRIISAGSDREVDSSRWGEFFQTADYTRDLVLTGDEILPRWDTKDPGVRLAEAWAGYLATLARFESER